MIEVTYQQMELALKRLKYVFFKGVYNLNMICVRKNTAVPDLFDDTYLMVYEGHGKVKRVFHAPITADPGLYALQNPSNPKGTAILKPGQYRGAYAPGYHRGYAAFVQVKPVTVWRDGNKDNRLDFGGREDTGMFGINIHRTIKDSFAATVGRHSYGCQVIQADIDLQYARELNRMQKRHVGTAAMTYTLIWESDIPTLQ